MAPTIQIIPAVAPPVVIYSSSVPMYICPSGVVSANGALGSLSNGLPYSSAYACYLYLPAGAAFAGAAAGWYYTVMTSTTSGTIYNNLYSGSGPPLILVNPTPIVAAGPGGFTGVTAVVQGPSIVLPANLAPAGFLRSTWLVSGINNANAKTVTWAINGSTLLQFSLAGSSAAQTQHNVYFRGAQPPSAGGTGSISLTTVPAGTSASFGTAASYGNTQSVQPGTTLTYSINMQLATATDFVGLEGGIIEVCTSTVLPSSSQPGGL